MKTVVITGGASGIGLAFSQHLAEEGWHVCIIDSNVSALQLIDGVGISTFIGDVTDFKQMTTIINTITDTIGTIDRLIHCAAIMPAGKLATMSAPITIHLMTVNYGGMVNVIQAILPTMLAQDSGELIVFGSSGGAVPVPDCGAYCATKAATNTYMEILMEENRASNVQFMLVCPPLVNTPLLTQAMTTAAPKMLRYSLDNKRYMTTDDIVKAVIKGMQKKTKILWPSTEAKILQWLRRFSPRLLWKIIHSAN
jgi:NADP-dependent 3-hydroxy acid dehydrogenase YdfG